ncbi:UNVERIFIED_ORG: hypothetical protein B2H93_18230 [Clostridium botulinum]
MADKRMFSKQIIDSDAFLEMPLSTQALYFHLSMRADDDGFLNNAKKIMRLICANQNDYDLLLAKRFTIQFDDGICVIKHWRINNYLRKDRYKETLYKEEKAQLRIKENGTYTLDTDVGKPLVYQHETQIRIEENRLDKNSIDKDNKELLIFYEQLGFETINSKIATDLQVLADRFTKSWVIEAIKEADKANVKNLKYVKGILKNWKANGKNTNNSKNEPKPLRFNNFQAREYDYDSLEKKLLGWNEEEGNESNN